ncbi:MAG: DUF2258 domain-containing protein, partial [Fervidicoccaceae archaeon]
MVAEQVEVSPPAGRLHLVRTGPVRTSGYALKLRRAVNAVLRDAYKSGRLDSRQVNQTITELNRVIYDVMVGRYEIPKESIVNVQVELEERESVVVVKNVLIELWNRDELLSRALTKEVLKRLSSQAAGGGAGAPSAP